MFSPKEMLAGHALNKYDKYHTCKHSAWLLKYVMNEKVPLGGPTSLVI